MKIVKVKYSRLSSDGNYNNETHGAEAIVEENEDPIAAYGDLVNWVDDIVQKRGFKRGEFQELEYDIQSLRMKESKLTREIIALEEKSKRMIEFLKRHGVEIKNDEIPF